MKKKALRIIEISKFYNIVQEFDDGYFAIYAPSSTILILNKCKEHRGSVYLKDEIEIPTHKRKWEDK